MFWLYIANKLRQVTKQRIPLRGINCRVEYVDYHCFPTLPVGNRCLKGWIHCDCDTHDDKPRASASDAS